MLNSKEAIQFIEKTVVISGPVGAEHTEIRLYPESPADNVIDLARTYPLSPLLWEELTKVTLTDEQQSLLLNDLDSIGDPVSLYLFLTKVDFSRPDYQKILEEYFAKNDVDSVWSQIPLINIRRLILYPNSDLSEKTYSLWDQIYKGNTYNQILRSNGGALHLAFPENISHNSNQQIVPLEKFAQTDGPVSRNAYTSLREKTPEEALNLLKSLGLFYLVSKKNITTLEFLGTYGIAIRWPQARSIIQDGRVFQVAAIQTLSGKGVTQIDSFLSGFFELAERINATCGYHPDWPQGYIKSDNFIYGPASHQYQYPTLDPNRLDLELPYGDEPINWIRGQRLLPDGNGDDILLPAQAVFLDPLMHEIQFTHASSNALGSGATMNEAILHALSEVMERDAVYTGLPLDHDHFRLTTNSSDDPFTFTISELSNRSVSPVIVDMTNEFGVPAYRAYYTLEDGSLVSGAGCHPDGRIAVARAVCEAGIKCAAITRQKGQIGIDSEKPLSLPVRDYENLPNYSSGSVSGDIKLLLQLLSVNGYDVYMADLTHNNLPIPTVRLIIPGLDRPFHLTKRHVQALFRAQKKLNKYK